MTGTKPLLGGVELGRTKCTCSIGTAPDDIREQVSVPTGSEPLAALGLGRRRLVIYSAVSYEETCIRCQLIVWSLLRL